MGACSEMRPSVVEQVRWVSKVEDSDEENSSLSPAYLILITGHVITCTVGGNRSEIG
jgi:hypothetical protein